MCRHFALVPAAVALIGGITRIAAAQTPAELVAYPNLVLYNGKVVTVDAQFTVAEAVAVRDGRILAVGTNVQIKRLVGPSTRSIDLQGKTVVPGFIDSDGMLRIVGAAVGPVDGASDDGGILTNQPKLRVSEAVGGSPTGINKWTGTSFTGRHWADLSAAERAQTEAGTLLLLRKRGWNIRCGWSPATPPSSSAKRRCWDQSSRESTAISWYWTAITWECRSIASTRSSR